MKGELNTSVYRKKIYAGDCLNFKSICPAKYKEAVVKTLLHRAFNISSTWEAFHNEITSKKQLLVNDEYPIKLIDEQISNFLSLKFNKISIQIITPPNITLFYRNQFNSNFKQEEIMLRQIVKKNIVPADKEKKISLCIFYRNKKLKR